MTLVAERVVESARDLHPAFDRKRNPDPVVLRALSRYVRELQGRVAAIDETALAVSTTESLPLATFEDGIALPPNRYILSVTAKDERSTDAAPWLNPVTLIPYAHRHDRGQPTAAAWVLGDVLYLRSPESMWKTQTEIGIAYIPVPEDLTSLSDEIPLPDQAENALVTTTALVMAKRGHNDPALPGIEVTAFIRDAERAENEYLHDVANRMTGVRFKTRETWP